MVSMIPKHTSGCHYDWIDSKGIALAASTQDSGLSLYHADHCSHLCF